MSVLHDLEGWPAGPLHVALGVFDGVHVGHRALIAELVEGARRDGARAIVGTFDPLPEVSLGGDPHGSSLTTIAERVRLLHQAGADDVSVFRFDAAFASQSAELYLERLRAAGAIRRVVIGRDFRFGTGRIGDARTMQEAGRRHGFDASIVEPVTIGGGIVSSTRIRELLRAGDVTTTAVLLGREYSVDGTVEHGDRRGRELGYPTINVVTSLEKLLPKDGIYACRVAVGDRTYSAATSLGTRPTFGPGPRLLECYLLGFSGDLYGSQVRVSFVRRLRDEETFSDPGALAEQIARDVDDTRAALG